MLHRHKNGLSQPSKVITETSIEESSPRNESRQNRGSMIDLRDTRRNSGNEPSPSYLKLLGRSSDMQSPLKQFAQKHGMKLADTDADKSQGNQRQSEDVSELTKVTPRSELSPRSHQSARQPTPTAKSYVISETTQETAEAAGIPVVDSVSDSCTDITFTSLDQSNQKDRPSSPIQLIEMPECQTNGELTSPVTSFADVHRERLRGSSVGQSVDGSDSTDGSLKDQFVKQKVEKDGE